MIELVISGGQTGADQAAWRAARRCSIPTGGWMPRGFLTEDGPRPEFKELYGATEHESKKYPARTEANIAFADLTIVFQHERRWSPGTKLSKTLCGTYHKLLYIICRADPRIPPDQMAAELRDYSLTVRTDGMVSLNVAGNRESKAPGIGEWVESYLIDVFRLTGHPVISEPPLVAHRHP